MAESLQINFSSRELVRMMLGRAELECSQRRILNALNLVRTVLKSYPRNREARAALIEYFLYYLIADLLADKSEKDESVINAIRLENPNNELIEEIITYCDKLQSVLSLAESGDRERASSITHRVENPEIVTTFDKMFLQAAKQEDEGEEMEESEEDAFQRHAFLLMLIKGIL